MAPWALAAPGWPGPHLTLMSSCAGPKAFAEGPKASLIEGRWQGGLLGLAEGMEQDLSPQH